MDLFFTIDRERLLFNIQCIDFKCNAFLFSHYIAMVNTQ